MTQPDIIVVIRNDQDAVQHLADVPFVLYAGRQAAKFFWSLVCKRWPELRGLR